MSSEEVWSEKEKLGELITDGIESDVIIKVGVYDIPAHIVALELNSNLMENAFTDLLISKLPLVYLGPEFSESVDMVRQAINSFYNREINLECTLEDLKLFHKFACIYDVGWLLELTLKKLTDMVEANYHIFIDLYKFASSIVCKFLKKICLDTIDAARMDQLIENNDLSGMDYILVWEIFQLKTPVIPEGKKFEMIRKWYEADTGGRKPQIRQLLKNVNFNRMYHADCNRISNWIFESQTIDESVCIEITKAAQLRLQGLNNPYAEVAMQTIKKQLEKKKRGEYDTLTTEELISG